MINDMFVIDCSIHVYDLSTSNLQLGDEAAHARQWLLNLAGSRRSPAGKDVKFDRRWSADDVFEMVFIDSPTDMAMAQVVPLFDFFEGFFAPVDLQHEMASRYPERVMFCGGVDPLYRGLDAALDEIEHQIVDLGAISMKFYNSHKFESWRCDDEEIAYPLYDKIRSLGVNTIQFHKGLPIATQPLEPLSPLDLGKAARDFPDMNFVIHHLATPPNAYFDYACSLASRHPNIYLACSGNINLAAIAPRRVQEQLGRMLMEVGVDKLLWGSEAALAYGPAPYLDVFMDVEIPDDLRENYGYPQITNEDRRKILGENFARLFGIDIPSKSAELANTPRVRREVVTTGGE